MSDLKLHRGCYVQLRDGRIKGPLKYVEHALYPWQVSDSKHDDESWTENGRTYDGGPSPCHTDIARVLGDHEYIKADAGNRLFMVIKNREAVAPGVLKAAMDAGLKAPPTYELFVQAVVEAAFEAVGKRERPVPYQITRQALHAAAMKGLEARRDMASPNDEVAEVIVDEMTRLINMATSENESAPGSSAVPKTEGGQSGWRNVAAKLNKNRAYGQIVANSRMGDQWLKDIEKDVAEKALLRTLDRLHPATKAFLDAIYLDAPLRAVSFDDERTLIADYGRPRKTVASIVLVIDDGRLPMWIEVAPGDGA